MKEIFFVFQDLATKEVKASGSRVSSLYKMNKTICPVSLNKHVAVVANNPFAFSSSSSSTKIVHARLGHASLSKLKHLQLC